VAAGRGFFAKVRDLMTDRDATIAKVNAWRTWLISGVVQAGGLAVDATAEKFKTTAVFIWRRNGIQFTKAATSAIVFSASHVVTASKYGVILVQITDAGVVSTKVPTSPQAYNTAPLALAALPAADAGNTVVGYIAIANNAGDWTANTDDLTDGSDLTTATFVDATVATIPAALAGV
jgi:hypothetical protein